MPSFKFKITTKKSEIIQLLQKMTWCDMFVEYLKKNITWICASQRQSFKDILKNSWFEKYPKINSLANIFKYMFVQSQQ